MRMPLLWVPCLACGLVACEEKPVGSGAAATTATATTPATAVASTPPSAAASASAPASSARAQMPPRPIPKGATTVGQGMPQDVQMQAITYMMAMQAPHDDDPQADPAWAEALAKRLAPIVASIDKGSAAEKARLGKTEAQAGGRRVDLLLASGCDAQLPVKAVVQRGGTSLSELLSHGVLVVRCNDAHWQCLQSTRDPEDVLCTTAPRHGK